MNRYKILMVGALLLGVTLSLLSQQASRPSQARTTAIVFGVGSPSINAERSGTSIGIVAGGTLYLFDAGPGVERRIMEAHEALQKLAVREFGPVFITHTHRDHTTGLAALLGYHKMNGGLLTLSRSEDPMPMTVYGPDGVGENATPSIVDIMEHFRAAFARGSLDRFPVNAVKIVPGLIYEDPILKVTAFQVDHIPNSFGFRIETRDRVIVISGDTMPSDVVADACNGCDLLFHEVYGLVHSADPTAAYHTNATALGEVAKRGRPKKLVVYHDVRAPHPAALAAIRKSFSGKVIFARDLDTF